MQPSAKRCFGLRQLLPPLGPMMCTGSVSAVDSVWLSCLCQLLGRIRCMADSVLSSLSAVHVSGHVVGCQVG
eukprot:14475531-Alexandrium_andersonii.AAC.1